MLQEVRLIKPEWRHYRVIHSRFPPTNVFDSVDARDQLLLAELESATNDRLTNWRYWLPTEDFRSGPGWGAVMASFCHFSPGRFNDDTFGVYYCSDSVHTAIAEWTYHAGKFWLEHGFTDQADATVRSYVGSFTESLIDVRDIPDLHTDSYDIPQRLAREIRQQHSGILYRSVRHEGGLCTGLFRPKATTPVRQSAHYTIQWNGQQFTQYAQLSDYHAI